MSWTPVTEQSETWVEILNAPQRSFSPFVFSRTPVFSVGSVAGIWDDEVEQPEVWTP